MALFLNIFPISNFSKMLKIEVEYAEKCFELHKLEPEEI